jgi:hypothetical protein
MMHFSLRWEKPMRDLFTKSIAAVFIATVSLVVLTSGPVAIAQTGGGSGSASSGAASQSPSGREAPVGHRQPRADQVPPEKNLGNPNDPINKEDAALDRKIKSICRGC